MNRAWRAARGRIAPLLLAWIPPLAAAAAIFHFSSESRPLPGSMLLRIPKLLHCLGYATLGFLLARALRLTGIGGSPLLPAWAAAALYGASDESHQAFTPLRHASGFDLCYDAAGALAGVLIWRWLARRRERRA